MDAWTFFKAWGMSFYPKTNRTPINTYLLWHSNALSSNLHRFAGLSTAWLILSWATRWAQACIPWLHFWASPHTLNMAGMKLSSSDGVMTCTWRYFQNTAIVMNTIASGTRFFVSCLQHLRLWFVVSHITCLRDHSIILSLIDTETIPLGLFYIYSFSKHIWS